LEIPLKSIRTVRERWIRAKYEQKLFLSPEKIPDPEKELFVAAKKNEYLRLLELLVRGVGCDFPWEEKKTALHVAIEQGSKGYFGGNLIKETFCVFCCWFRMVRI
jgi:hypothetical protein